MCYQVREVDVAPKTEVEFRLLQQGSDRTRGVAGDVDAATNTLLGQLEGLRAIFQGAVATAVAQTRDPIQQRMTAISRDMRDIADLINTTGQGTHSVDQAHAPRVTQVSSALYGR
jgi:uncharacterized protein YukE